MIDSVSNLLIAVAAFTGPVLVFVNSRRAGRDAIKQASAANKILEAKHDIDVWREITERHEKDRDHAHERASQAWELLDAEREKRKQIEDRLDELLQLTNKLVEQLLSTSTIEATQLASVNRALRSPSSDEIAEHELLESEQDAKQTRRDSSSD